MELAEASRRNLAGHNGIAHIAAAVVGSRRHQGARPLGFGPSRSCVHRRRFMR